MTELTLEELRSQWAKMNITDMETTWDMVFNELCSDGFIRPVSIAPKQVTSIKRPDSPIDGSRYGLPAEFKGGTYIVHNGREILLFEDFGIVVPALGATITASDHWGMHLFFAGIEFEKWDAKYLREFMPTTSSNVFGRTTPSNVEP